MNCKGIYMDRVSIDLELAEYTPEIISLPGYCLEIDYGDGLVDCDNEGKRDQMDQTDQTDQTQKIIHAFISHELSTDQLLLFDKPIPKNDFLRACTEYFKLKELR